MEKKKRNTLLGKKGNMMGRGVVVTCGIREREAHKKKRQER